MSAGREPLHRPDRFTRCYGCGPDNARGLGLQFYREDDFVVSELTPAADHGGFGRVVHGGVTSTVLDEAFGWTIYGVLGKLGMTTRLEVEFKAPLYCGQVARVRGWVERHDDREAVVKAQVTDAKGGVAAEGTGVMRFVSKRAIERLSGLGGG